MDGSQSTGKGLPGIIALFGRRVVDRSHFVESGIQREAICELVLGGVSNLGIRAIEGGTAEDQIAIGIADLSPMQ